MTTPVTTKPLTQTIAEIDAVRIALLSAANRSDALRLPCEMTARSLATVLALAQHTAPEGEAAVRATLERQLTTSITSLGTVVRLTPGAAKWIGDLPMRLSTALSET